MSNKKRRDITLGEMQDECSFRGDNCETIGGDKCKFFELCATMQTIDKGCLTPIMWNLADPPRFNEAQMAFWRGWHAMGAGLVTRFDEGHMVFSTICGDDLGTIERYFDIVDIMEKGETLDLAELLGKDAT